MSEENISGDEEDATNEETDALSKQRQGVRYWDSNEEQLLIEVWKKYSNVAKQFTENAPVFRRISMDMHSRGVFVNKQECRRKLCTLNHKYNKELEKIRKKNKIKSDWRLFPLIHNVCKERSGGVKDEQQEETQKDYPAELFRSSYVMKHFFTLTGVEKLRRQNQALFCEFKENERSLIIKKQELRFIKKMHKYLDNCLNQLDKDSIKSTDMLPQIPFILLQTFALFKNL